MPKSQVSRGFLELRVPERRYRVFEKLENPWKVPNLTPSKPWLSSLTVRNVRLESLTYENAALPWAPPVLVAFQVIVKIRAFHHESHGNPRCFEGE